uniref:Uncharacterized protein n=1 Tax=Panagrolaimus sp. JU765 TaxID=591449 RepID=A0AC34Q3X3_9BILA
MIAVGFQAPLPNQLDDEWALHRYNAKVFMPNNDWEKYWNNPPRELPTIPTNLVQIQQVGLAKSADQIQETIKDKKKDKDDKKKKMYSSTPALVDEPYNEREVVDKQPSPPPPQLQPSPPPPQPQPAKKSTSSSSTSSSSSSSSSSESEEEPVPIPVPVAPVKEKKKKQPKPKPRSHTIEVDRAPIKKGYPEPQASDSRFYDVLKPVKDVPQRPLPAPKTRKYEPRSQSVAPIEMHRPKKSEKIHHNKGE